MFDNEARVLLILPQEVLDRARALAGTATATLKLPVSLQIVLRALIEEGLKREGDRRLLANIQTQAQAIRRIRSLARTAGREATSNSPSRRQRVRSRGEPKGRRL
jgi:hypothetical protein